MDYIPIEIGGQKRGLKFNQLAYINFYKMVDMEDYEGTFHYAAVWAGLKANAYIKREEFTEIFETVCGWVDALSIKDKEEIVNVFANTSIFQTLVDKGEEEKEAPKKKKSKNIMKTV